ncbi:alpha-glucan family phosphorylase [Lentiprolixibacter aurantiacus]|uniref:Alpha-glucan family phosphorylase n=1 Tax=Lentiprolixibacter aurantiacus TaxID=2993939 RepID=A0AAE3SN22_9FLAO|nr:alpha-glucan family phosphorylase [Lentiprolixibacter aurantiacus]MCX2719159.1 alpha-glucan family phosphorylase [Lentiprolixibacter aurantiacus]
MTSKYAKWHHPYKPSQKFQKKVAYFSMEFGIDQGLKIYSGGLGFLAGSHMKAAHDLKQNLIGIGMLWKYGYYDQYRNPDQTLLPAFIEKNYCYLEDTGIELQVRIRNNHAVKVGVLVLKPEIFNTAPIYLLTTDVDGNDHLSRTITNRLYDPNDETRIAQSIILGVGGAKLVEILGGADIYHLNEGHALPAFYYLRNRGVSKEQMVFTTHTPEKGGHEERFGPMLNDFGFFERRLNDDELERETVSGNQLNYTIAALRMVKRANAVSKLHSKVARHMYEGVSGIAGVIPITNSQHQGFWQDSKLGQAWKKNNPVAFRKRKLELKEELFGEVLNQTGKIFDPRALTIVWARRFAEYKRADLLLYDLQRFEQIISNSSYPVQIIWAGKPYPGDHGAIGIFNRLVHYTRHKANLAVLTGYEIALSRLLKEGSDIWLNTPRITREASGTSGMTAAMNGSVNLSTRDGWIPEFIRNGKNGFVLPALDHNLPHGEQDYKDSQNLYKILEDKVMPIYYDKPGNWSEIVFNGIEGVVPQFTSARMATEYYEKLYR